MKIHEHIGNELQGFGGILRCEACKTEMPLGDAKSYIRYGWPMCHGITMTWITQKQIDEQKVTT